MTLLNAVKFVGVLCGFFCSSLALASANDGLFSNNYHFDESMFESNSGQLEFLWNARVSGETANLDTQSAEVGGVDVNALSKYTLVDNLELRVFLRGKFFTGRSQSFYGDIEPDSGIFVREAAVRYMPFKSLGLDILDLKAGVLNQDWLDTAMLIYKKSFPGASAELFYQWNEELRTGFVSQYTIPTSQTLSARTIDKEATPTLTTQTLYAKWQKENFMAVKVSGNLFEYQNLPSFVAFESQKRGNSTLFINGPNNSQFRFPFRGWFTKAEVSGYITPMFEPVVYLDVLRNQEAPDTFNDGQVIGLATMVHLQDYKIEFRYENIFIESDAVPGFYNAWAYGNTNKEGQGYEVVVNFLKKKFRVKAQYYDMKLINPDPLQQNQQYFFLGVETGYDKI
jgi:hypothetical protein